MKRILQIVFLGLSVFFTYMIYKSITGPLEFKEIKQQRYTEVINRLKDIRDAQEAYLKVNGEFAPNFETLVNFIDNGKFTITTQRDTSWVEYNKTFRIDEMKQGVVIDTLGTVSVKDSLFKNDERYKKMMYVPYAQNKDTKFEMTAKKLEKNGYNAPVFEASVKKDVVLYDQPKDLVTIENQVKSVEDIDGDVIRVGSLTDISTNGNWPTLYDARAKKK